MKLYDVFFFIALIALVAGKNQRLLVVAGIVSLILSMLNYTLLVSFRGPSDILSHIGFGPVKVSLATAERFTWYAGGFFLSYVLIRLLKSLSQR